MAMMGSLMACHGLLYCAAAANTTDRRRDNVGGLLVSFLVPAPPSRCLPAGSPGPAPMVQSHDSVVASPSACRVTSHRGSWGYSWWRG